jgi:hypothetical protein
MSSCRIIHRRPFSRHSFALIATLALVAISTILLVIFVTVMRMDRAASFSYSQSFKAQQLAYGGLHLVVGELQTEMQKDAPPDTGGFGDSAAVYTNVTTANILPQRIGTNSAMPILVKTSTNAPFFTGGANAVSTLQASSVNSSEASLNGRYVSARRWSGACLGTFPDNNSTPAWVVMTRAGPTNAANIGFGANLPTSLNNPALQNTNYAIGRFAYAVYDEGGLLDVTAAGYPTNAITSPSQLQTIKGTLAGADLTQVGITDPQAFVAWRNAATGVNANSYINYVTNFASTNGFSQIAPGDTSFLSRQDLIAAAQSGVAGLTTDCLTNLTTFTRELNAPTWAPATNAPAGGLYNYAKNAAVSTSSPFSTTTPNPNRSVLTVRRPNAGTVTAYQANGQSYQYQVSAGDPLLAHRFPLDRLGWLTPGGPAPGISAAAIQACFGLVWAAPSSDNPDLNWTTLGTTKCLWQYVGPTGSKEQGAIETLDQVAAEATPREPNFFEILQAGILSGSLGVNILADNNNYGRLSNATINPFPTMDQSYPVLQVLRIGASMISQVQSSAYPVNVEYLQKDKNTGNVSLVACGVANLPYISAFQPLVGASPTDANYNFLLASNKQNKPKHTISTYFLFQLWNPTQQSAKTPVTRPNVRVCLQGNMGIASGWAKPNYPTGLANYWGFTVNVAANNTWLQLANSTAVGVNGFLNPTPITKADVASRQDPTPTAGNWIDTQVGAAPCLDPRISYEAFHLTNTDGSDLSVDLSQNLGAVVGQSGGTPQFWQSNADVLLDCSSVTPPVTFAQAENLPPDPTRTFQVLLKYQDPNGNWIPYDYWIGDNDPHYWAYLAALGNSAIEATVALPPLPPNGTAPYAVPALCDPFNCTGGFAPAISPLAGCHATTALTCDPRSIRFGPWFHTGEDNGNGFAEAAYTSRESLWSGNVAADGSPLANHPDTVHATWGTSGYGGSYNYGGNPSTPAPSVPSLLGNPMGQDTTTPFNTFFLPAWLCRNNMPNTLTSSAGSTFSSYKDTDGIQRLADSGLFTTLPTTLAPATGNPFYTGTTGRTSDRPVILNRPFNSVGELGYTFRDDPWRSLDFFSASNGVSTSADSGLLDFFTVTDTTNNFVAGRCSLNTQNTAVLQAIFNSTVADPTGDTATVPVISNPAAVAQALAAYTKTTPMLNKEQLVTGFGPSLPVGGTVGLPFSSTDEQNVKACREAYVRSLADVGQTRTWNLMIDVIAQAGRYPPSATGLDQFVAEGESRYWLHVAIDRFTGQIVDEKIEPVNQ